MIKIYLVKQRLILSTALLVFTYYTHAQTNIFPSTGSAGIGTTIPNASSILEMVSTTKGLLVPRMSKNQRDAIAQFPPEGLLIYQTNATPGFYYYAGIGSGWRAIAPKAGWSLTGNAGTDPAVNFIGTTDAHPMIFRVNNQKAGYLDYNSDNTGFGVGTLSWTTTGGANTANGYDALYSNTSGYNNTANGAYALYTNTVGHNNTANGYRALITNNTGYYNAATGAFSLENNIGGMGNTGNGISSLRNNTSGNDNTGAGANTLFYNKTGHSNVAVGSNALFHDTSSSNLVAVGDSALYNFNGGYGYNTAVGSKALYSNTTGSENTANGAQTLYSNTEGSGNTASSIQTLYRNTTGNENTAIGYSASYENSTGHHNTATGTVALYHNTTGNDNTAIGNSALTRNMSGSYNTAIGTYADVNSIDASYSNSSAFGYQATITASNQVRIGSNNVTSIGGFRAWTNLSDGRVKKNIKENVPGLVFINLLRPITYNLDLEAADKILQRPAIKDRNGKFIQLSQEEINARRIQQQVVCTGFIAQDVEAAAKKIGYDFDGVDAAKNDKDLYGLRYSEFVVPLVKAVQELSAANDSLKKQNEAQQKINIDLQTRLAKLEAIMNVQQSTTNTKLQTTNLSSASLDQNIPNPFSKTTTINYSLPKTYSSAYIIVSDQNGKSLKQITLSAKGSGNVDLDASTLASGAYSYSLIVDGKLIDTKKMVLAK